MAALTVRPAMARSTIPAPPPAAWPRLGPFPPAPPFPPANPAVRCWSNFAASWENEGLAAIVSSEGGRWLGSRSEGVAPVLSLPLPPGHKASSFETEVSENARTEITKTKRCSSYLVYKERRRKLMISNFFSPSLHISPSSSSSPIHP